MVHARGQNSDQSENGLNGNLIAILASIQQRLEEQAVMMQQQSAIIQNLQQQQVNRGAGNGGPKNEGPRFGENPIGEGHGPERGPQPVIARQEPLYQ